MSGVRDTSIISYFDNLPKVGDKQAEVLQAITKLGTPTNLEISSFLGWPINQITPRVNELVKKGLVEERWKRPCHISGRLAIAWQRAVF